MNNQYYLYHKLIQYAVEHKNDIISPYYDIFQKDDNLELKPGDMKPIIDRLEEDNLITTYEGYGAEYKRVKINHDKTDFLKEGGYLNLDELKIHEILRFLFEETEKNSNKCTFVSDEIQQELFLKQLQLPISVGEVNHLLKILIEDNVVIDCSTKENIGTIIILVVDETTNAYHRKKYLKAINIITLQKFHIENLQSNSGVIHGNQIFSVNKLPITQKKRRMNLIEVISLVVGVISLVVGVIGIVVMIMIAKGII